MFTELSTYLNNEEFEVENGAIKDRRGHGEAGKITDNVGSGKPRMGQYPRTKCGS